MRSSQKRSDSFGRQYKTFSNHFTIHSELRSERKMYELVHCVWRICAIGLRKLFYLVQDRSNGSFIKTSILMYEHIYLNEYMNKNVKHKAYQKLQLRAALCKEMKNIEAFKRSGALDTEGVY